jgi:hypothetical protein
VVPPLRFAGLPDRYTAVRFYSSTMCPDTPVVRAQIRQVLEAVAAETAIVLLEAGIRADDHAEIAAAAGLPVVRLDALITPATNLEVQTRAIAGASQFVGTYGGFAYLAPFLGIDAEGFHGPAAPFTDKMLRFHLEFARGIFRRDSRYGELVVTPLSARPRLAACHV